MIRLKEFDEIILDMEDAKRTFEVEISLLDSSMSKKVQCKEVFEALKKVTTMIREMKSMYRE